MTLQNPIEQSPISENFQENSLFPENALGPHHEERDSVLEFGQGLETFFQDSSGIEDMAYSNMNGKHPQGVNLYTLDPAVHRESRQEKSSEMPPPYERAECRNRPVFDPPTTDDSFDTYNLEFAELGQEVTRKKRKIISSWFDSCGSIALSLMIILLSMAAPAVVIIATILYIKRKR